VERRERGGAGQRRAAEGGAVHAGLEQIRGALADPDGADGETAAEALGHADGVGADARVLERVEFAGATDAALHLVEQEQQLVFVAELAQAEEELRGGRRDAAFALNRLDEDGGGLL